ncbi:MAG: MSCRAMM family protein, partial [Saccharofermentanales bacterium]
MKIKIISLFLCFTMLMTIIPSTLVNAIIIPTDYDLTINEALTPPDYKSAEINSAYWEVFRPDGSTGTGVFDSFLRVQNDGSEKGYNTDASPEFDAKSGKWTRALALDEVPKMAFNSTVTPPGITIGTYSGREFVLDINESGSDPNLWLENFQVWMTDDPELSGYDPLTGSFPAGDATMVWDLGANRIHLDYAVNTGSGGGDYRVIIPESFFQAALTATGLTASEAFIVVYTNHTDSDSGFEEWAIRIFDKSEMKIVKVDQFGNPVPGAVFEISKLSDFSIIEATGTTDANGFILLSDIITGTYYVREVSAPAGYVKSDEVKTVILTKDALSTVTFTNTEIGNMKLIKVDQFNNPVAGAIFEISSTSAFTTFTTLGTTDADGFILVTGMDAGTYYIREKLAPAGYVKSDEIKTVTIDKDVLALVSFTNLETGDLKLIKVDQFENPVPGAIFEISSTSTFTTVTTLGTTDADGFISVTGMNAGTYYIREKSAPAGYVKSDDVKMVTIDKDAVATVTFENTEIGDLKLTKVDQFENPVAGAIFEISKTSDFASYTTLGTTGSDGFIIATGIEAGTYYIREKSAPAGYVKSDEIKTVTIDKDT